MNADKDFKTVTLTFNRANKDTKDILVKFMELTGKSKVDIIADALRQYDPNKAEALDKNDIRQMIKEVLNEEGLIKNQNKESKEIEDDTINKLAELNEKKLKQSFLDDDD